MTRLFKFKQSDIECKIRPNKPTRLQEVKMEELKEYGAEVFVAYSLGDIVERLY